MASSAAPESSNAKLQRRGSYYRVIGERIGSFFARLHSSRTLAQVTGPDGRGEEFLYNPKAREVVHEFAIRPIKALLDSFPDMFENTKPDVLFQRIEADFLRQTLGDELALAIGDCWTGAILAGTDENDPITGVIDWEFACLGRGVNGDMSQLMAHLHLFKLAAEGRGEELLLQGITSLIQSITSTYHEQSIKEAAKWMPGPVTPLNTLQATVMRSAFLDRKSVV